MKESPNVDDPQADIKFIVEELFDLFNSAECENESHMMLCSAVGSTFHARVMNAAKYLGIYCVT